jgi:hypothetical protein
VVARPVAPDLAGLAAELARLAQRAEDAGPGEVADAVVALGAGWVPGARWASISTRARGGFRTTAATGEGALRVDAAQYAAGSGPCLAALSGAGVQHTPDLLADPRWPDFAGRVRDEELPALAVLSHPLAAAGGRPSASLNLYADQPGAFADDPVRTAALLVATAAASALAAAHAHDQVRHLRRALDSHRRIGIATGVLMALDKVDEEAAFAKLLRASQETNRKLHDLAREVAETGVLPDRRAGS